jgi:hypothetical protein
VRLVTLDFETYYDTQYSLSKLTTEQYVRDPRFEVILVGAKVNDLEPVWFSGTMEEIKAWLLNLGIERAFLLCHHTAFDGLILNHHFGITPKFYLDTMSMAKPLHGQTIGVSLDALAKRYTVGMKGDALVNYIGKRRADFTKVDLARYGGYCTNDVQLTYMLFQILKQELPRDELKVIDLFVRMFTQPTLELDGDFLQKHLGVVQARRANLLAKLGELGGEDVIMSNPKFAELLRSLDVDPPTKISARTGNPTFAFSKQDQEFKALLFHPDELVRTAVEVRLGLKSTIEESRTEAFIGIASRGAWPVYLHYYGAHTGRASGGDGVNPQNLHRGGALRKAVRAPKGYRLVAGDSSQIEARVTALLAGQDDLVEDFRNKVDIYSNFASLVYGRPIDRKRKVMQANGQAFFPDEAEGFVGKTCILGLGFGMGGKKLQHTLGLGIGGPAVNLDLGRCHDIVDLYRSKYRRIAQLWQSGDKALNAVIKGEEYSFGPNGLLKTSSEGIHLPNGMVIRYPGLTYIPREGFVYAKNRREQAEWVKQNLSGQWNAGLLTRIYGGKVIENVVQAIARIVVFDQMLKIAQHCKVVLTVHDEVVACVPEGSVEQTVTLVTQTMTLPPAWAPTLPIACEVHSGETYGEAK